MHLFLPITKIVIHCSATQNGKALRTSKQTAAQRLDEWHRQRGFKRSDVYTKQFNPHLSHIGYHYVIDTDGTVETGRMVGEIGAHVKGHNQYSVGICLVGGINQLGKNHGEYAEKQWNALHRLLRKLESEYPSARICGHRDLSPDLNNDGTITPNEWVKDCPCFDVWSWLDSEQVVNLEHLYRG
ncbi:N-acetylmuramoyl-L-alanine amidase [[Haemophilus] ducreyi]|uniref:N-acetylmuramoyl-L-alanine amidase n=1 Tax=Haemophilus ducreyi TaxID=730 RepID=A0AAC8ZA43_HAEDC|nr:N-acetylmuramoyl-L-alanine amidase [[Haemophilus] ducreyi]AKO30290.1 N-acetylmuramoyl-L-alanine amidase [[Haemophilus] ducreyi]AKO31723.1 N-acetylmuramoyl-L-alanine amidase [[Haemophilus] ducreyi]AKO33176.1 N-acetylmuramoyl-L-alanine amidase [[Haemophilus] ducreyi]AKO34625.1 N-acetylmuramoyl-L-alanine amidase [[Haemophilus] ducreyi]AKO36056.1 N-acetylmuramoyl-L-alanine amidase [[Haemophilus] ducreyi]